MKLEHKIGIAITCTFLCLTGAVIGLKLQEQTPSDSPSLAFRVVLAFAPLVSIAGSLVSDAPKQTWVLFCNTPLVEEIFRA